MAVPDSEGAGEGTYRITTSFGFKANPGTKVFYRLVNGNDYWVGDKNDPRTYNLFQPYASAKRTWRISQAERLATYPVQYEYAAVINFNRPPDQQRGPAGECLHVQWLRVLAVDPVADAAQPHEVAQALLLGGTAGHARDGARAG